MRYLIGIVLLVAALWTLLAGTAFLGLLGPVSALQAGALLFILWISLRYLFAIVGSAMLVGKGRFGNSKFF